MIALHALWSTIGAPKEAEGLFDTAMLTVASASKQAHKETGKAINWRNLDEK
jgi:hypothetical protein